MTSQMIRNRLVVGIQNLKLSEQLQMDPNLTLETAKKLIRQCEAVQEHQAILQQAANADKPPVIEQIRHKKKPSHPPSRNAQAQQQTKCKRCGNKSHALNKLNVLQECLHATNAKGKGTTVASVYQKQYLKSQQSNLKKT